MAVLNRESFFSRLNEVVGASKTDETIAFIEDMTDTYNDLEQRANGDGEDWKTKYNELDAAWKQKYQHRFFSGNGNSNYGNGGEENKPQVTDNTITINDLFK